MEQKQIFREKSLERVTSPEELNNYIRVVGVGTWILLCALIAFLIGAVIWCAAIKLEAKSVTAAAVVQNGEVCLYLSEQDKDSIAEGMTVHVGETELSLPACELNAVKLFSVTDYEIMDILGEDGENFLYTAEFPADIPNGIYTAKIVLTDIRPLELLFN